MNDGRERSSGNEVSFDATRASDRGTRDSAFSKPPEAKEPQDAVSHWDTARQPQSAPPRRAGRRRPSLRARMPKAKADATQFGSGQLYDPFAALRTLSITRRWGARAGPCNRPPHPHAGFFAGGELQAIAQSGESRACLWLVLQASHWEIIMAIVMATVSPSGTQAELRADASMRATRVAWAAVNLSPSATVDRKRKAVRRTHHGWTVELVDSGTRIGNSEVAQWQLWKLARAAHGNTSTPARTGHQTAAKQSLCAGSGNIPNQNAKRRAQAPPSCSWCTSSWSPSIMSSCAPRGQLGAE